MLNNTRIFCLLCLFSVLLVGCDSSWNPWGAKKEKELPTSEEVVQIEDTEELKRLAKDALLKLEAEKEAVATAKKEVEAAQKKLDEANLKTQKAELETERAQLQAEKHQAPKTWSEEVDGGIRRFANDPFMVIAYVLLTATFCLLYHLLVQGGAAIAAYAALVFVLIPAFVLGYAAYSSASLGVIVTVGGGVASFMYSVVKNHPVKKKK